jgi:A/G-specific adenine glycosylase
MLQQTQVATVIPFYRRFLKSFPSIRSLARAPMEEVLAAWSGMGYYRRARNLHRAAQIISEEFGGRFPSSYEHARSLPGVGDYTARAVLSIAYHLSYSVLDGNVARVISRIGTIPGRPGDSSFRRAVQHELERLLSRRQPGAFNQALMELGQTVCLPRAPLCTRCPARKWCRAKCLGRQESFPAPKLRRTPEPRHLAVAVALRGLRAGLVRGLDEGLLGDLWNFPSAFGRTRADSRRNLQKKLEATARGPVSIGRSLGELRHNITFRVIRVHLFAMEIPAGRGGFRWLALSRLSHAAVSQLSRKIAAFIASCAR